MNNGGIHEVRGVRTTMADGRHSSGAWPDDAQSGFYVGEAVGFIFEPEPARSTSRATHTSSATWRSSGDCGLPAVPAWIVDFGAPRDAAVRAG